jgi:FtsH-binding integral membrane protein
MGNSLAQEIESGPHRRRTRQKKSSKERYETRRKLKAIFLWLMLGLIGVVFVALIAVYAGGAGGGGE